MSAGLTQDNLAERLGVVRTTVAMWETGKSIPRADLLPDLAKILGCSIEDLLQSLKQKQNKEG